MNTEELRRLMEADRLHGILCRNNLEAIAETNCKRLGIDHERESVEKDLVYEMIFNGLSSADVLAELEARAIGGKS